MSSLFGQVWFWSLLAFLIGAVLTWALLVRPAQQRVQQLERHPADDARKRASRPVEPESVYPPRNRPAWPGETRQQEPPVDAEQHPPTTWLERDSLPGGGTYAQPEAYQQPDEHTRDDYAEGYSGGEQYAVGEDQAGAGHDAYRDSSLDSLLNPGSTDVEGRHTAYDDRTELDQFDDLTTTTEALDGYEDLGGAAPPVERGLFEPAAPSEPERSGYDEAERDDERAAWAHENSFTAQLPAVTAEVEEPVADEAPAEVEDAPRAESDIDPVTGLPKRRRGASNRIRGGFSPPRPIQPSIRSVARRTPQQSEVNSGSLFEPVQGEAGRGNDDYAGPPPARNATGTMGSVNPGPFGPGSAMPLPGGDRPDPAFNVKASVTALRYCTEDSPQFPRMVAEVWFASVDDAERVGFRPLT